MKRLSIWIAVWSLMGSLHAQMNENDKQKGQSFQRPLQEVKQNPQSPSAQEVKKSTPSQDAHPENKPADQGEKKTEKKEVKKEEKKEAEEPKSPHTFTGSASFVSDYRFRGISQTMRQPAVQGVFDYSHRSGIYLGTFGSNVDGTTHFYNNTSLEWDFYGGYKAKPLPCFLPDFAYNIGVIYYYYPGGQAFVPERVRYNTCEYYIELTYKWLSIKFSQSLTDYFGVNSANPPTNWEKHRFDHPNGSSRGSTYIEANLTFELWQKFCLRFLKGKKLTLILHAGHVTVRNYEHVSYTEWRATLTQEFEWFNVFLSYVGTNARHAYFDVPDNSFHPRKRHLGVQGMVFGVIRSF